RVPCRSFLFLQVLLPPRSPLFPYTPLFRSRFAGRPTLAACYRQASAVGRHEADLLAVALKQHAVDRVTAVFGCCGKERAADERADRKSTRLNSSHVKISYAVFCLKKKKTST